METTDTLAIIGKSGHGKVIADIARANGYTEIVWVDDDISKPETVTVEEFIREYSGMPVALGIGDNAIRQRIYRHLKESNIELLTLVHPSAVISSSVLIGEGSVVMPLAVINSDAILEAGVIVNTHATVEHDCLLGAFSHISPNAALAGEVKVGTRTHIGIGVSVIQQCTVGDDVVIAAGSVVIEHVPDDVMVAGVPAIIKKRMS